MASFKGHNPLRVNQEEWSSRGKYSNLTVLPPSLPRCFHWPNLTGGQRARALLKLTIESPGEEGRLEKEAQGSGDEQKTSSTTGQTS